MSNIIQHTANLLSQLANDKTNIGVCLETTEDKDTAFAVVSLF